MNLLEHPDLADRLAAAYALGTLRGGARRRFEAQARQSPRLRAAALAWQERFAALTELQQMQAPGPNVWKRIENLIAAEPRTTANDEPAGNRGRLARLWRTAALGASLATVAALGVSVYLMSRLQAAPDIRYVAVLADDRSQASVLVTFDPAHNTLTLKRLGGFQEGPDKSLQLWALPASGSPQSLGVLGANPVMRIAAAADQVRQTPALAVSLEPRGGVPGAGGPTGPVLFKGALLQTP